MKINTPRVLTPFIAFALSLGFCFPAAANPSGESVSAGSASFQRDGNTLRIKTGQQTIIDWKSFSIGSGESTQFLQPSSKDVTLNRVIGSDGSNIFGSLQSNGRIVLLNPNGILIGPSGKVDVAGFIASTLNVTNEEFLKGGDLNFFGDSQASVTNQGAIHAIGGDVFLIGRNIENSGSISASKGKAGLGAGGEVLIKQTGEERVFVKPGSGGSSAVSNTGSIAAVTAELKAHGNPYALAINNTGIIRATGVARQGGRVLLTANQGNIKSSGTISARKSNQSGGTVTINALSGDATNSGLIEASGTKAGVVGGEVRLLGDRVSLEGAGKVDASGDAGGGTVLIGGDFHGGNALVQNAKETLIAPGTSVTADALTKGNAGRVIVWSDDTTAFGGSISARGGKVSGNGGFVEVSGKGNLQFNGAVETGASKGKDGTLLMDPEDITISVSGTDNPTILESLPPTQGIGIALGGTTESFILSPSSLQIIHGNIVLQAQRDITLMSGSALVLSNQMPGERLVLQAGRNLTLNSAITTAGADIYLEADRGIEWLNQGTLAIHAPISTSGGGFIQLLAANFDITSPVSSGKTRSTRIAPSHEGDLIIGGSGCTLTAAGLDMLNTSYQVWVGRAYSAGGDGLGGVSTPGIGGAELTARSITFNAASVMHAKAPLLFFSSGDVNVNASVTTPLRTSFANQSGTLHTFTVVNGATFGNGSGGLELGGYDLDLQTSGTVKAKLTIGNSAYPIYLGNFGGASPSIQISQSELQRITASALTLSSDAADIFVDNISAQDSAKIAWLNLYAGAPSGSGTGAVRFVNNASSFKKLSVSANGGVTVSAPLSVEGAVSFSADRFGAGTGVFANSAPVTSSSNQAISIEAADVQIGSALATTGTVSFLPSNSSRSIGLGSGSGDFNLSQQEIDLVGSNHALLTIGRGLQNVIEVGNSSFALPVTLQSQTIRLTGSLGVSGGQFPLNFRGGVVLGGNAVVKNSGGNILFASTLTDGTTGGHSLQVNAGSGTVTFQGVIGSGSTGAPGALSVSADGNVLFKSAVWLGGDTSVTSGTGNVLFSSSLKSTGTMGIRPSLNLLASSGSATVMGALGSGSNAFGALSIHAARDIALKGAVVLGGTANLSTPGGSILLSSINDYLPGADSLNLDAGGGTITLNAIGTGKLQALKDLKINNAALTLLNGSVTTTGSQTYSGPVQLNNSVTLTTTGGDIAFQSTLNSKPASPKALTITTGTLGSGRVTLNGDVGGNSPLASLQITTGLDIITSSLLNLNGTFKLLALGDINLNNPANAFGSLNVTGRNVFIQKTGDLTLSGAAVKGGLDLLATGTISQTGAIKVTGSSSFDGTTVALGNLGNSFGNSIAITSDSNAVLTNSVATILGVSNVGGSLTVTSRGVTTQSGVLDVAGLAKFTATGSGTSGRITLQLGNSFGALQITGVNASVTQSDSINLAAASLSQSLALNSTSGSISQTGTLALNVSGTFSASANGSITLSNTTNTLAAIGNISTGDSLALLDSKSGLILAGPINAANDALILSKGGTLTISGSAGVTAQSITLVTPSSFINKAGLGALTPTSGGRYLIYCAYPSSLGGLLPGWFEHYVSYPTAPSSPSHDTLNGVMMSN